MKKYNTNFICQDLRIDKINLLSIQLVTGKKPRPLPVTKRILMITLVIRHSPFCPFEGWGKRHRFLLRKSVRF